jgi:hypothetical protein
MTPLAVIVHSTTIISRETVRAMTGLTVGDFPMLNQAGPAGIFRRAPEAWFVENAERKRGFGRDADFLPYDKLYGSAK